MNNSSVSPTVVYLEFILIAGKKFSGCSQSLVGFILAAHSTAKPYATKWMANEQFFFVTQTGLQFQFQNVSARDQF